MKAVILAGGKGTRLHPLTSQLPKPLVRVLDQPVMAHILALLAHYGVDEAVVTVSYLAHRIRNHFGEEFGGIRLRYSHEEIPLGTAGGVRAATELLAVDSEESILVISGDAVCDFDLEQAARFHREHCADATLLLQHSDRPLAYGVVKCAEDGRVLGLVEKPEWSQVCSDRVNTGIYFLKKRVLEQIPQGIPFDFSADLFPRMISEGARLYGCLCDGYWKDIGSLQSYRDCNLDALNDKIRLYLPSDGKIYTARDGKWYCSYGARVHEDARIGGGTVLGRGCVVEEDAVIRQSILCDDCVVEKGAVIRDSVLDRSVRVGRNVLVAADSVIGYGSHLGEGSHCISLRLPMESRLSRETEGGAELEDGVWEEDRFLFARSKDGQGLRRFGAALAQCFPGPFFLSSQGETADLRFLSEGMAGRCRYRTDAPLASVSAYSAQAFSGYGVHLSSEGKGLLSLRVYLPDGLSVPREKRRSLTAAFNSCPSLEERGREGEPPLLSVREAYLISLLRLLPRSLEKVKLETEASSLFGEALRLRSWQNGEGQTLCLGLSSEGQDCFVSFSSGEPYSFSHLRSLFLRESPVGIRPARSLPGAWEERWRSRGEGYFSHRELIDPCYALCYLLHWIENHSLEQLQASLRQSDPCDPVCRFYPYDGRYGPFTQQLERLFSRAGMEPMVIYRPQGSLHIVPSAFRGYRIYAEAKKAEAAEELFAFAEERLKAD